MLTRKLVIAVLALVASGAQPLAASRVAKPQIHAIPGWGEVVELGELPPDQFQRLQIIFTGNDYPIRALREGQEGLVESWVMVGPNGRAAQVGIVRAPSRLIGELTLGLLMRRFRMKFPEWPGKFVRIKLPPIQYLIVDNCTNRVAAPAIEYAVQIRGTLICPTDQPMVEGWQVLPPETPSAPATPKP